jgi:hypothetical protein
MIRDALAFLAAMVVTILPHRHWSRLPGSFPVNAAAFASALVTFFCGAAIGIPGFLEHMAATVSLANETTLKYDFFNRGLSSGFAGLSIFTFLLLTPKGWLTMYLLGTGGLRMAAVWFDDPIGDPVLTIVDSKLFRRREKRRGERELQTREELEGPEIPDRIVSSAQAGLPACDLVIVASRAKPGWSRGVVVYTADTCYRIGDPVERTIAGNLRTLYPLTEHTDLEAVRRSVQYDLPT